MLAAAASLCGVAFQAQSVNAAPKEGAPDPATAALIKKAEQTIIPEIKFQELTPEAAARAIAAKSGIAVIYHGPANNPMRITLSLTNVPASEALRYVANLSNLTVVYHKNEASLEKADPGAAAPDAPFPAAPFPLAAPAAQPAANLVTREWRVAAGFLEETPGARGKSVQENLIARGVVFPPGSAATYLPAKAGLIVRNTQANLDLIDVIVEQNTKKARR